MPPATPETHIQAYHASGVRGVLISKLDSMETSGYYSYTDWVVCKTTGESAPGGAGIASEIGGREYHACDAPQPRFRAGLARGTDLAYRRLAADDRPAHLYLHADRVGAGYQHHVHGRRRAAAPARIGGRRLRGPLEPQMDDDRHQSASPARPAAAAPRPRHAHALHHR